MDDKGNVVEVTRLNHSHLVLNADLIEHMEETPDTVVVMANGQKFVVRESVQAVVEKVIAFRRAIASAGVALREG